MMELLILLSFPYLLLLLDKPYFSEIIITLIYNINTQFIYGYLDKIKNHFELVAFIIYVVMETSYYLPP